MHNRELMFVGGPLDGLIAFFNGDTLVIDGIDEELSESSGIKIHPDGLLSIIFYRRRVSKLLRYKQTGTDSVNLAFDRQWDTLDDFRADMDDEREMRH